MRRRLSALRGGDGDQPFGLKPAQDAAGQAGIQLQLLADLRHVRALRRDQLQHARHAKRAATAKVGRVQRPHRAGDSAVVKRRRRATFVSMVDPGLL